MRLIFRRDFLSRNCGNGWRTGKGDVVIPCAARHEMTRCRFEACFERTHDTKLQSRLALNGPRICGAAFYSAPRPDDRVSEFLSLRRFLNLNQRQTEMQIFARERVVAVGGDDRVADFGDDEIDGCAVLLAR